jgi:hypothetical protein
LGSSNIANIIIFAVAGLLIAVLTGLEAAFKWENTSAELKSLATVSRDASRKAASSLVKTFATKQDKERLEELEKILDILDEAIVDVQKKAAAIGIETVSLNNMYGSHSVPVSDDISVDVW